jgi:hypothetical protein
LKFTQGRRWAAPESPKKPLFLRTAQWELIMTTTHAIRTFDKIALRLFHSVVLLGLGAIAFGAVAQSLQV